MQTGSGTEETAIGRFGKFILRKRLGAGGMAEVFLAEMVGPEGFGKLVALKRILPHLTDEESFTDSFISEARLGGCLNHPNIVQTLELGREGEHYYLAMEYVQGITLAQLLRHRKRRNAPLPLSVVLDIARQICDALAYAHAATDPRGNPLKMIHRDLKPDNVLLSMFGVVKITDFGVAKATSNLHKTVNQVVKGTIGYMSPEQATGETLDHRSDLYSLGAIIFEMLTLEPLYPDAVGFPGLFKVQKGDVSARLPLLQGYPDRLVDLLTRLLSAKRDDRPASALEIKRELTAVAATVPTSLLDVSDMVREAIEDQASAKPRGSFAEPLGPAAASQPPTAPEQTLARAARSPRVSALITPAEGTDLPADPATPLPGGSSPSLVQPAARPSTDQPVSPSPGSESESPGFAGKSSEVHVGTAQEERTADSGPKVPPPRVESLWHAPEESAVPGPTKPDGAQDEDPAATRLIPSARSVEPEGEDSIQTRLIPSLRKAAPVSEPTPRSTSVDEVSTPGDSASPEREVMDETASSSKRWPVVLAAVVLLAVAAGGAVFMMMGGGHGRDVASRPSPPAPTTAASQVAALPVAPEVSTPRPSPVPEMAGASSASTARPSESPAATPAGGGAGEGQAASTGSTADSGNGGTESQAPSATSASPGDSQAETGNRVERRTVGGPHAASSTSSRTSSHAYGYITVNARPWAYVYVDGKKLEQTTPLSDVRLRAGRHRLVFKTADGRTVGPIGVVLHPNEHKVLEPIIFE